MSNPSGYNPQQGGQPYGQQSAPQWGAQGQGPYPGSQPSAPGTGYGAGTPGTGYGAPASGTGYGAPAGQTGYGQTGYGQTGYGTTAYPGSSLTDPPPKKKRSPMVLVLAIGIPLLVVALIAGLVMFLSSQDSPEKAMKGYAQALIDGDSKKALSYLDEDPADKTLLTDAVLKSLKDADHGVSKINSVSKTYASVQIGGKTVSLSLKPHKVGGSYKVSGVSNLQIKTSIPLKVGGHTFESGDQQVPVFPGIYDVEATSDYFALSGTSVDASYLGYDPSYWENAQLTQKGEKAVRDAVKKSLGDCLAQKKMAPPNCPQKYRQPSDGTVIDESTIVVTMVGNNPVDTAPVSYSDGKSRVSFTLKTKAEATGTSPQGDTKKMTAEGTDYASAKVDMTADPLTVNWN